MTVIDLRSDTVTKPTQQMREAIAAAEVGDDVFGDDPTVVRLESMACDLMEKEAAPAQQGIRTVLMSGKRIRMTVHYEIDDQAIQTTIQRFRQLLNA